MAKVELYKLQNDGSQEVVVTCKLQDSIAVCEGDEKIVANLTKAGIRNYDATPTTTVFPKDGMVFLEQLKSNYRSSYMNASDVIPEKNPESKL